MSWAGGGGSYFNPVDNYKAHLNYEVLSLSFVTIHFYMSSNWVILIHFEVGIMVAIHSSRQNMFKLSESTCDMIGTVHV